jgi:hypothetical protein
MFTLKQQLHYLVEGLTTDTVDRLQTFILPGVKEDGTPNDIQINNSLLF